MQPRETPFLALLANATAVVEGRVIEKGELPMLGGTPIAYVDIEVQTVLSGTVPQAKLRVWSDIGLRTTCPTPNHLETLGMSDTGIFAIRTVPIDQRITVQVKHDIRTLIVTHAIVRSQVAARPLGIRHDNGCPFGCAYFETTTLDDLRAKIAALKRP